MPVTPDRCHATKRAQTMNGLLAVCNSRLDFDLQSASAPLSQLAGVMAAVLFPAFVVVLGRVNAQAQSTESAGTTSAWRRHVMILMPLAFTYLVASSYLFALGSGDRACARGGLLDMFGGGLLALGVLMMFVAITWLCESFRPPTTEAADAQLTHGELIKTLVVTVYVVGGIALVFFSGTILDAEVRGTSDVRELWPDAVQLIVTLAPALILVVATLGWPPVRRWFRERGRKLSGRLLNGYLALSMIGAFWAGYFLSADDRPFDDVVVLGLASVYLLFFAAVALSLIGQVGAAAADEVT